MSDTAQKICGDIQQVLKRARCMILVQRCEEAPSGRIEIVSGDISIDAADSRSCTKSVAEQMGGVVPAEPQTQSQISPALQSVPRPLPPPQPQSAPAPAYSAPRAPANSAGYSLPPMPPPSDEGQNASTYTQATEPPSPTQQYPTSPMAMPGNYSLPTTLQSLPPQATPPVPQFTNTPPASGANSLRKPFAVQLITDGRVMKAKRKILVGNGKGFAVNVEYSAKPAATAGRYILSYVITGDGVPPMSPRTLEFSATDGRTELCFEISLTGIDDKLNILSIGIVEGSATGSIT